jgi:carbohydrate-selective porin OprB
MLFVFFAMMLAPIGGNIATAQQIDTSQQLAQDADDTAGEDDTPGEEDDTSGEGDDTAAEGDDGLEPLETEEPGLPTEMPTEEPTTATLQIIKGVCDSPGFDPYAATTASDLLDNCAQNTSDATFSLSNPDGYSDTMATSGSYAEKEVPAGQLTVTEDIPEGYGEPVVACQSTIPAAIGLVATSGGSATLTIEAGDTFGCYWFNVPTPTDADLFIYKYTCPEGYDVHADGADPMIDCAEGPDGVTFNAEGPDGYSAQTDTGDSTQYAVMFGGLAEGSYTITETLPDGTASSFIWDCVVGDMTNPVQEDPLAEGTQIMLDMVPGQDVVCHWFNVPEDGYTPLNGTEEPTEEPTEMPTEEGDGNSITVIKWDCEPGTMYGQDEDYYSAECDTQHTGIPFSVVDANGEHEDVSQADGVTWNNVEIGQEGELQIIETVPDGYGDPVVYCWTDLTDPELYPSANGFVVPQNLGDEPWSFHCNWYNIPEDGEGSTTITIHKWVCDEGYVPDPTDVAGLAENCDTPLEGVFFSMSSDTDGEGGGPSDASGTAEFGAPYGQPIHVSEDLPAGYGQPVVRCTILGPDDELVSDLGVMTVGPGYTVEFAPLAEGQYIVCDWYNVHAGPSDLIIMKYTCPDGYDPHAEGADPFTDCVEGPNGVTFTADGPDGYHAQTDTGDSIPNGVMFGGLEAGDYTITETLPEGITHAFVWSCEPATVLTFMQPTGPLSEGSTFDYTATGIDTVCYWFNIPGHDNTVVIYKWICPEGTTWDHDQAWYEANCTMATDDIKFILYTDTGSATAYPTGGMIEWTGVPLGPIGIQEYLPSEYGEPMVYCSINGSDWEHYPAPTAYIVNEAFGTSGDQSGYEFVCQWYNIPGGPGEITVYKYTCPEGYDPEAWGADPASDCTEGPNGVTFTADGPDGYHAQTDTGDSVEYAVYFGGLEPGDYTITEQIPDGIALAFVWDCYGQTMGELRPTPLSIGDTLPIEVHAGESIVCHWYNVPEDPDGSLTVIKYECSTKTWVSEVDCEVYEDGQGFDLVWWNGDDWEWAAEGTTDSAGYSTWYDLDAGEYWLDEHDREWCHLSSDWLSDDGNWINVYEGEETVVKVYNCTGEPGKPGKTPTKYPNTGVPLREEWRLTA